MGAKSKEIWNDREFQARFEGLVLLSERSSLIESLLCTGASGKEVSSRVGAVHRKFNIKTVRPRGKPLSATNRMFMRTPRERYHASVLLALATKANLPAAEADGTYVDHLIEVYQRYLWQTGSNPTDAVVRFDRFHELLNGLRDKVLVSRECPQCNATFVFKRASVLESHRSCPFCLEHQHVPYNTASVLGGHAVDGARA